MRLPAFPLRDAGCAILDEQGRVLLQQRTGENGKWGLPGGAIELGESVHAAAIRETLEETGLHVEPSRCWGYTRDLHTPTQR